MEELAGTCNWCGGELKVEGIDEGRTKRVTCRCKRCNRRILMYFDEEWNYLAEFPEDLVVKNEDLKKMIEEEGELLKEILTSSQIKALRDKLESREASPSNLSRARKRLKIIEELTGVHFEFLMF